MLHTMFKLSKRIKNHHPSVSIAHRPPLPLSLKHTATVMVMTNDGRTIVGTLRGFDQATNLILDECHERVFSRSSGVDQVPLGLYVVRGDNVAAVGDMDEEQDADIDLAKLRAPPLKPVKH
jgi:U6 snRNA-associated Sm-like protein LSm8